VLPENRAISGKSNLFLRIDKRMSKALQSRLLTNQDTAAELLSLPLTYNILRLSDRHYIPCQYYIPSIYLEVDFLLYTTFYWSLKIMDNAGCAVSVWKSKSFPSEPGVLYHKAPLPRQDQIQITSIEIVVRGLRVLGCSTLRLFWPPR
jgi:hypothetical protein